MTEKTLATKNKKSFSRLTLTGSGFIAGWLLGYYFGFYMFHEFCLNAGCLLNNSWIDWALKSVPNPKYLSDIVAIESVLIGASIPISFQVVNWSAERSGDVENAKFFIYEPLYRAQYYALLSNLVIIVFLEFIGVSNSTVLWIFFLWFVTNIVIFYNFILLVERYAVEMDEIIRKKLIKYVQNILEK